MNEKSTKRREWVKTAAIVFLSVMLVLTFFSQTIMNYSLPVVAAQYVTSGSITAKVRGTGTIEAGDPYSVELNETRVISSVAVKKGDTVEKDQVLFYLEDAESEELKAAEAELDALLLTFKKSLLAGDVSNSVIANAQSGVETPTATYQSRITAAQNKYDTLEAQVAELTKQKTLAGINGTVDTTAEETALMNAQTKLTDAQSTQATAQANLDAINGQITYASQADAESDRNNLETVANAYLLPMQNAEAAMNAAAAKVNTLVALKAARELYDTDSTNPEYAAALTAAVAAVNAAYNNPTFVIESTPIATINSELNTAQPAYETATVAYVAAKEDYDTAYAAYQKANTQVNLFSQKTAAETALGNANSALASAKQEVTNAQNALNNKKINGDTTATQNELDKKLLEATTARDQAKEALEQLLVDISKELDLGAQNSAIQEKREQIAKLREESVGAEVKAPVAGTITTLNYVAGETIKPDMPLAVIQPDGKGFSLTFSVTADQAKKLSPGDPADIQNAWYYSDITATLAQIKNDPQNPGKNKLLVFDITGDVMNGQSLSLSVGQKSANYDMIVPNSAIREDNNGKFILIVESKSSPLGNRYIATRVDVEVLASDDTQSAISGALYGYEFVITTSTKPVEAGKQVRLADN